MPVIPIAHIRLLRRTLFAWFRKNRRRLPWRETSDPWKIMISEIMLQQTQVSRAEEKYVEFVTRWPTPAAMARSPFAEVLRRWSGLGYNRRAKHLWEAARAIDRQWRGEVPRAAADLGSLPGIGRYTAGAIAAFAWNDDAAPVDTNISRVLQRVLAGGEFRRTPLSRDAVEALARQALPMGRSRDWYSALMDFGSAICTSRSPACGRCPLAAHCAAAPFFLSGRVRRRMLIRPQQRFQGSNRELRGAILRAVAAAPDGLTDAALPRAIGGGNGSDRARQTARTLAQEGLLERRRGRWRLPGPDTRGASTGAGNLVP